MQTVVDKGATLPRHFYSKQLEDLDDEVIFKFT